MNVTKKAARKSSRNFVNTDVSLNCNLLSIVHSFFQRFFALRLLRVDGPEADYAEDIRTAVLTASSIDQRYNRYNIHPYLYFA